MLDFKKITNVYTDSEAFIEANRCISCDLCNSTKACPTNVDVKSFIEAIKNQDLSSSIKTLKKENNLSHICGVLCNEECKTSCILDKPINIKKLELFVNERSRLRLSLDNSLSGLFVAVVGAGPTGLSAALELAKKGADVTVYDENLLPGGIFTNITPNYLLDNLIVEKLLTELEGYSVKILNNVFVNSKKIDDLLQFYNYILVCTGKNVCHSWKHLNDGLVKIINADDLLRKANKDVNRAGVPSFYLQGKTVILGDNYLSIVAARTCLRLGSKLVTLVTSSKYKNQEPLLLAINEGLDVRYDLEVETFMSLGSFTNIKFSDGSMLECNNIISGYKKRDLTPFNKIDLSKSEEELNGLKNFNTTNDKIFVAGNAIRDINSISEAVNEGKLLAQVIKGKYKYDTEHR